MSSEQNRAIVREFYEALNANSLAVMDEVIDRMVAPDIIVHDPFLGTVQGVAEYRKITHAFLNGFGKQRVIINEIVVQGDLVAVQHTHKAVHTGIFAGLPPTRRRVTFDGLELIRLRDGKVVEFWRHDDDSGLMRQLMGRWGGCLLALSALLPFGRGKRARATNGRGDSQAEP